MKNGVTQELTIGTLLYKAAWEESTWLSSESLNSEEMNEQVDIVGGRIESANGLVLLVKSWTHLH